MRNIVVMAIVALCLLLSAGSAVAQEQNFIFGEYYVCDQNREPIADLLVEHVYGPIYQKQVDAGNITGWGWLAHRIGGEWRRILISTGTDMAKIIAARGAIVAELQESAPNENRMFTEICDSHDDVIWRRVAGPIDPELSNVGNFSYSSYYFCNQAKQDRADEIFKELLEPAINKLVESGELKSWGWFAHAFGGIHRRLMTHSGMDQAALMASVVKYNEAAGETNQALANEFTEICGTHVDYMWNRMLPKPADN